LTLPIGIAVDTIHNEIFVTDHGSTQSVTVYERTATGNVTPLRTISSSKTGLSSPSGITVDTTNNEILVTNNNGGLTVYRRTDSGNISPVRTLTGGLRAPSGIAVDSIKNEIDLHDGILDVQQFRHFCLEHSCFLSPQRSRV